MATAVVSEELAPEQRWRLKLPERLPDLKGKWLTAYTVLWLAALALALIAPEYGAWLNYRAQQVVSWGDFGFSAFHEDHHRIIKDVFSVEARRAGIRSGDLILALDGVPAADVSTEEITRRQERPEGAPARLTIRHPNGEVRQVTVTKSRGNDDQRVEAAGVNPRVFESVLLIEALVPALILIPSSVLLFTRQRGKIVPSLLSLAFLLITTMIGPGENALSSWGVPLAVEAFLGDMAWAALLAGLVAFPNGRFEPRWSVLVLLFFPVEYPMDLLHRDFIGGLVGFAFFLPAVIALLIRYRQVATGVERQQLRWAFFGFVIGLACLLVVIFPLVFFADPLVARDFRWSIWLPIFVAPVGLLAVPTMALGLIVSIQKYRLYDADAVIGRSAAYGVLTLGFVALFAGAEKLAEIIGERYFEHSIGIVAGAVGAAVAAAVVVPLHNRVHRWAERRFQKPLIRLREGLPECVADLRESTPVEQLLAAVMSRVEAGVRSTREAVLLSDSGTLVPAGARNIAASAVEDWQAAWTAPLGDQTLDCDRHDPLFPLRVRLCVESAGEPETVGWLLLGPRPDGSFFGRDEREALAHVAGPVARAIHIAQLREQREASAEMRLSSLETLIAKLLNGPKEAPGGASFAVS